MNPRSICLAIAVIAKMTVLTATRASSATFLSSNRGDGPRTEGTSIMRKLELERLLEKTVAHALGVALPDEAHRRAPAKLPRHALPKRMGTFTVPRRHHHRIAEHA